MEAQLEEGCSKVEARLQERNDAEAKRRADLDNYAEVSSPPGGANPLGSGVNSPGRGVVTNQITVLSLLGQIILN